MSVYRIRLHPMRARWYRPWRRWKAYVQQVDDDGKNLLMYGHSIHARSEGKVRRQAEAWCRRHHERSHPRGAYEYHLTTP